MSDLTRDTLPDLAGKKVLVTGGLGFIGSNLVNRCVELGAEVTIYDCLDPRSGGNLRNIADVKDRVRVILNDIRNFEGLCAAVLDQHVIFSCAAYTSHPNAMKEPYVDIDVNCKGVLNLLEALRRFNPEGRLVHVGTSTQVGQMLINPVTELHPEFPVDIYSANKSAGEKYIQVYGHAYKMPTVVVRLANTFGPRSNIRSADFGFMNFFIGLALKGKTISVFGEGKQLRTVTFVDDSVAALIRAGFELTSCGEVYFATADQQYSVAEIATTIADEIGGKVQFIEWPKDREAIEIWDAVISSEKLHQALGWKACYDLRAGLKRTKAYYEPQLQYYLDK